MIGRIGLVLELAGQEPAFLLRDFGRPTHHALAALGGRRQDDLRAEHPHDLAAFDRERLGHEGYERIALRGAHHRERDTGIAGSRFANGLTRLERPGALGVFYDRDGEPVLDRAQRVEELALHVHRHVGGREALNTDDGGFADRAENIVVDHGGYLFWPVRFTPADEGLTSNGEASVEARPL